MTTSYPTDLSDSQWQFIEDYVKHKRKRRHSYRVLFTAIFYLVKTVCQWRMLPHDYPKWQTVYVYFSRWKRDGTLAQIQQTRVEKIRKKEGREAAPSAAVIDAQSVKTTLVAGESWGFDAGKKVKGRKRHIVVDTSGLILAVVIQSAATQDRNRADEVIKWLTHGWCCSKTVFAHGGYRGKVIERIRKTFSIDIQIMKHNETNQFSVLPKRWIVERTFA